MSSFKIEKQATGHVLIAHGKYRGRPSEAELYFWGVINALEGKLKEAEEFKEKVGQIICLRCIDTQGYDPEPQPVCCGNPIIDETGQYCCGSPEPDWDACSECGGTQKPPTKEPESPTAQESDDLPF